MICLKGFVIFTNLCLAQSALAEPKYTPQIIPKCKVLEVSPGNKRCTYTLYQVKELYRADADLVKLTDRNALQIRKITLQSNVIDWQQEQLRISANNATLAFERMAALTKLYVTTDKKLQSELARPKWGNYVAWGIAAAVATLFTGYVVADQVSK